MGPLRHGRLARSVHLLLAALAPLAFAGCGGDGTGPGGGGGDDDPVVSVAVTPGNLTLDVGESRALSASALGAGGSAVPASITWSSRDGDVATVSTSGVVTGVGPGSTVVEARAGGVVGTATVGVRAVGPVDLTAAPGDAGEIVLSWDGGGTDVDGFEVERSGQSGSGFARIATTAADEQRFVDATVQHETTYYYRVRATVAGEPTGYSNVADARTLPAPDPSSDYACEQDGYPCTWPEVEPTIFEESDGLADEILELLEGGGTIADALALLAGEPDVAEADGSLVAVRFRLRGGRPVWVLGPDARLLGEPPAAPSSPARARPAAPRPERSVVGDEPKTKRALVLSVYQFEFGAFDEGAELAALLGGARGYEGNVTYLANTSEAAQVGPADFKGWGDYDVVHVSTHGVQVCRDDGCKTVILAGKVEASSELTVGATDRGIDLAKVAYGEQSYGLDTDFFRSQYPGGLPDTIVFMSACQTSKGDDLAEALAGPGGAYLGWTESVWSSSAKKAALAFFGNLVEKGVPSTTAFLQLREGDDLTIDRPGTSGAIATLDIFTSGEDLRIREIVYPRNPLTKEDLPADFPYPVVGQPGDGQVDKIPFLIKVDGVEGDPSGFIVHVEVNGFSAEPVSLATGEPVGGDPNVWQVKGEVPVTFDAQQGQEVQIRARVELPEGGESEWDEDTRLGNPGLRYTSTITSEGGMEPLVRVESEVEGELDLALDADLEKLTGYDTLTYARFDVEVQAECSITTSTMDGRLRIVDGDFRVEEDEPVVPERLILFIPPTISETLTTTCNGHTISYPFIHYFAGFYSFHGGQLCGSENEVDEDLGGLVITGWSAGSGDVLARKVYDRSCTEEEVTFTEETTIELIDPRDTGG